MGLEISEPYEGILTEENKAFLDDVNDRVNELIERFGKQLIDIEERTGYIARFMHYYRVDGRVVRFTVELMPEALFCDYPEGECLEEQIELPLDEPKNKYAN